ncbi:MAG: TIGR01777 family oxidoreductase [Ignavibacteria bacterium]|nr:TIGR01777 family oxidoreductase [Ignavibacteria bacterium]
MKVAITGATGLIGKKLTKKLIERGDEVFVLSRSVDSAKQILPNASGFIEWGNNSNAWQSKLSGVEDVIHLAGENVMGRRWGAAHKKKVLESRVNGTRNLVDAISRLDVKPKTFISASAIGIYGNQENQVDESSAPAHDFLGNVVKAWEVETHKVDKLGIRRVNVRTGIVLDEKEGALAPMVKQFKFFLGGSIGNGNQWFSWIHVDDIVGIFLFALDNTNVSGAINGTAPTPVRMKDFAKTLGKVMHRPAIFNVPGFAMKIILGEGAEAVLGGANVKSEKIQKYGYKFRFEDLNAALINLLRK